MKCIIITAYCEQPIDKCVTIEPGDFIICADRGWKLALDAGILPDLVISDFDSYEGNTEVCEYIRVPTEKDDTDTMLCVKYALKNDMNKIILVGGTGGRLDHTIANIQTLLYAATRGADISLCDGRNTATVLCSAVSHKKTILRDDGCKLSVFAMGGRCTGVCERGVKYTLEGAMLEPGFPLGVSNEIIADSAEIEVDQGNLLIIVSRD